MHSLLSLSGGRVRRQSRELVTRYLQPGIRRGANRVLPSSWGTTIARLHMFQSDAGRTACTRPYSAAAWPLLIQRQRLPRGGLSTLNSMASGLAVYASPSELPQLDARLASSCWSGSTGRAFHPQGSDERFQSCRLHLVPLSQALLGAMDVTWGSSRIADFCLGGRDLSTLGTSRCAPRVIFTRVRDGRPRPQDRPVDWLAARRHLVLT